MSNDRIFIRCAGCWGWKLLVKYSPEYGFRADPDFGALPWIERHALCHRKMNAMSLEGDPGFTLHTEADYGKALLNDLNGFSPSIQDIVAARMETDFDEVQVSSPWYRKKDSGK